MRQSRLAGRFVGPGVGRRGRLKELPSGTVTFLFTDIEGSTKLVAALGADFGALLERHRALVDAALDRWGGVVFGTAGDSVHAAFGSASSAIAAALDAQRALIAEEWPTGSTISVRMGIHSGEAQPLAGDYIGLAVHEAARMADAGHGGQILVSGITSALAASTLPPESSLKGLGQFVFRDISRPLDVFQLLHPNLPSDFGPLRTRSAVPSNLPAQITTFVGRDHELSAVRELLTSTRAVTIHGPGGCGKTRLALEAASAERGRFEDGVWLVDLAPLQPDGDPATTAATALGIVDGPDGGPHAHPLERITDHLIPRSTLLVIDNCEHVVEQASALVDHLVRNAPGLTVLATSQRPLDIAGEVVVQLAPLPAGEGDLDSDAVTLFVDRARSHDGSFQADDATRATIAQICSRLDGLPLAIELAAAHTRSLSVDEIAERLGNRLSFLTHGPRSHVDRQRTLRSTIDWGYSLLSRDEQTLFAHLSVFSGGFTLDAAEAICGGGEVSAAEVYDLLSSLVDRSLVVRRFHRGRARYYLLETIKEYALERLSTLVAPEHPRGADGIVMRREGDVWAFECNGTAFRLRDTKGLRYLATLLASPGRDFFVMDLVDVAEGATAIEATTRRAIGDAGEVADRKALQAYRHRLSDLEADIDEARSWNDVERVRALEDEMSALTRELAAAANLRGDPRRASSSAERARMSVTKAIRAAISKVAEQAPDLGERLSAGVRTGTRCSYTPGEMRWEVHA